MALTKSRAKAIRALAQRKYREETGVFVVEGLRLVREAAAAEFEIEEALYTPEFAAEGAGRMLLDTLRAKCRRIDQITLRDMDHLADTVTPQGILAVVRQKREQATSLLERRVLPPVLVALDAVSDPGNLGSIVRGCDWFGVDAVLLGHTSVDPYNPKVVRASMGGIFHLPVVGEVDLLPFISHARGKGYTVYVTDVTGEADVDRVRFEPRSLIVFGNEAWGVSDPVRQLADVRMSIRRFGSAESLNVAVACGVVLAALRRTGTA